MQTKKLSKIFTMKNIGNITYISGIVVLIIALILINHKIISNGIDLYNSGLVIITFGVTLSYIKLTNNDKHYTKSRHKFLIISLGVLSTLITILIFINLFKSRVELVRVNFSELLLTNFHLLFGMLVLILILILTIFLLLNVVYILLSFIKLLKNKNQQNPKVIISNKSYNKNSQKNNHFKTILFLFISLSILIGVITLTDIKYILIYQINKSDLEFIYKESINSKISYLNTSYDGVHFTDASGISNIYIKLNNEVVLPTNYNMTTLEKNKLKKIDNKLKDLYALSEFESREKYVEFKLSRGFVRTPDGLYGCRKGYIKIDSNIKIGDWIGHYKITKLIEFGNGWYFYEGLDYK
ncbi:hypothetical protein QJU43_04630 [Pasteurella atlantica]|uniref:Uncharacterized protein n=2 Tax=Pasteurellaceae TaxID=712 RepID=A0ACC6HKM1_9PAST|nr:hypothetical protein [Pasteurella atlantica]MDP8033589.1 hypothetical protein [Pasteurella atlantica]MDP8035631.1 hypothetical protein [Pasteurella atlantica]MDP8037582.1 hypothetical protein [Pasteurella atlantica]MDP8047931.1 hypothetical protein [Pasteurella atlantica]MDP8049886.1 hypothetical protein [Pasteurella atlantica]